MGATYIEPYKRSFVRTRFVTISFYFSNLIDTIANFANKITDQESIKRDRSRHQIRAYIRDIRVSLLSSYLRFSNFHSYADSIETSKSFEWQAWRFCLRLFQTLIN